MPLKNAFKVLVSRFGVVWSILLFLLFFSVLMVALSLSFVLPIVVNLQRAGIQTELEELYRLIFRETLTLQNVTDQIGAIFEAVREVFRSRAGLTTRTIVFVVIFMFVYKLLIGYYEVPVTELLKSKMSANAKIGFFGKFVANLGFSTKFILVKMIYTLLADTIIYLAVFGLIHLWGVNALLTLMLPFIIMLTLIVLKALRYSAIALWVPNMSMGKGKIFKSLGYSFKQFAKQPGRIYGSFVLTWLGIIVINFFVGIITFGAGLLITIPMTMAFICTLNLTLYYHANGLRYYIEEDRVTNDTVRAGASGTEPPLSERDKM